tara:strand:+ start:306 stop:671 length:366 start_codon:yes stop_codon:yes gene_type:complete
MMNKTKNRILVVRVKETNPLLRFPFSPRISLPVRRELMNECAEKNALLFSEEKKSAFAKAEKRGRENSALCCKTLSLSLSLLCSRSNATEKKSARREQQNRELTAFEPSFEREREKKKRKP